MIRNKGWVKLYRKVQQSEIWKTLEGRSVWTELLLEASHANRREVIHNITGQNISVERGQCLIAMRPFAERCLVSFQSLRSVLEKMQKLGMISTEVMGKGGYRLTLISLLNFEAHNPTQRLTQQPTQPNSLKIELNQIEPTQPPTQRPTQSVEVIQELNKENGRRERTAANGAAPPPTDSPSEKDRELRDHILKGLELYQADPKLNHVDKRGRIAVVEIYRLLKGLYPAVDVTAQIREAHAWEVTHPNRQKKNRAAYLHRWMKSDQKDGGVFKHGPITKDSPPRKDRIVPAAESYTPPIAAAAYHDPADWIPPTDEDLKPFRDFRKAAPKLEAVR